MANTAGRACIIGAGPSGLSALCWFAKFKKDGKEIPELVCYEKQSDWGGMWNYSWRTHVDEYGEPVHGSMYRYLWNNGPKESIEIPHYTYDEHFGKPLPSYGPRELMFDYLKGRWEKQEIRQHVRFSTVVRDVCYREETNDFVVATKDLANDQDLPEEVFDYVVVATGHFSVPNVPSFLGIDQFPGRVIHSHELRDAKEFAGMRVLAIGGSLSAADVALQCYKFGAKKIIITWRTKPLQIKGAEEIEERPLVQKFVGKTAFFKDGSQADVDAVILCTGYHHHYPFLRQNLRLKTENIFYPLNLYKGIVWTEGGNNKLLYLGAGDQYFTFNFFDVCGLFAAKLILGEITLPSHQHMKSDIETWNNRCKTVNDFIDGIDFQADHMLDLVRMCGSDYPYDPDTRDILKKFVADWGTNCLTYRDQVYVSKQTGTKSTELKVPFMKAMEDYSLDSFLKLQQS